MKQIFESERIRFVEVSELLIPDYLVMVNDMERVQRFIGPPHEPFTEKDEVRWVREKLTERAAVFSMLEKSGGAFIGNIELADLRGGEGELGVAITAAKQDMGYGTEAVSALVAYAFGALGLERIVLRVRPHNARAIHVYESCGFREVRRMDEHICMEIVRPKENQP